MVSKIKWLIIFLAPIVLLGQDIHFSQFNRSYLNLNPALAGNFSGSYRLNANYKNQWASVSDPYTTFSFSGEAKSPIKKLPQLHLGLLLFQDEAGSGNLKTTQIGLNTSYSLKLDNDSSFYLFLGAKTFFQSKSIQFDKFNFDNQFNGDQFDPSLPNNEKFGSGSFSNINLSIGAVLGYIIANRKKITFGVSANNLLKTENSFLNSSVTTEQRNNFFLEADYFLSEKLDLIPLILFSSQQKFRENIFGANIRYRLNESPINKRNLYLGFHYRNKDALIGKIGLDYKQWNVGLSYDLNTSDLELASRNRGGTEIAITYIINTFKTSIRKFKRCPSFL